MRLFANDQNKITCGKLLAVESVVVVLFLLLLVFPPMHSNHILCVLTLDPEMQHEIDTFLSKGEAIFSVLLLVGLLLV